MFESIIQFCKQRIDEFHLITQERKDILKQLADSIQLAKQKNGSAHLIFICTHNSRRSHLAQIFSNVAASYFDINDTYHFSGGTEATAMYKNIVATLHNIGFHILKSGEDKNPDYFLRYGNHLPIFCFSKSYNDKYNPQQNFIAVMTCSDAEQNCPFIPNAFKRISVKYSDPKAADDTLQWEIVYMEKAKEICREMLYTYSLLQ